MWRLRARWRDSGRDRGATAVIIAILVPVVLLGIGAVVLDVGSWYAERAQTQNGADAGAQAVAQSCASGTCDLTAANAYAPSNSNGSIDTSSEVTQGFPCGGNFDKFSTPITNAPPACPAGSENGTICPAAQTSVPYVDVLVNTVNPSDSSNTLVPDFLGKALLGDSYRGKTVGACAQATLSAVGGGTGLALTMSVCDWLADTGATKAGDPNAKYATPEPPYPSNAWPPAYPGTVTGKIAAVPNVGGENVVQITGAGKCGAGQSGLNVPGGFGWLSNQANGQTPAGCSVTTSAGGFVYSSSGGIGGQNGICGTKLQQIYNAGTSIPNTSNPIFLPIFDAQCGSDGKLQPDDTTSCTSLYAGMPNSSYHIAGYAQFVLTGYDYNPLHASSMINGKGACKGGSIDCMYGLFTQGLVSASQVSGGGSTSFGATFVGLSG